MPCQKCYLKQYRVDIDGFQVELYWAFMLTVSNFKHEVTWLFRMEKTRAGYDTERQCRQRIWHIGANANFSIYSLFGETERTGYAGGARILFRTVSSSSFCNDEGAKIYLSVRFKTSNDRSKDLYLFQNASFVKNHSLHRLLYWKMLTVFPGLNRFTTYIWAYLSVRKNMLSSFIDQKEWWRSQGELISGEIIKLNESALSSQSKPLSPVLDWDASVSGLHVVFSCNGRSMQSKLLFLSCGVRWMLERKAYRAMDVLLSINGFYIDSATRFGNCSNIPDFHNMFPDIVRKLVLQDYRRGWFVLEHNKFAQRRSCV